MLPSWQVPSESSALLDCLCIRRDLTVDPPFFDLVASSEMLSLKKSWAVVLYDQSDMFYSSGTKVDFGRVALLHAHRCIEFHICIRFSY